MGTDRVGHGIRLKLSDDQGWGRRVVSEEEWKYGEKAISAAMEQVLRILENTCAQEMDGTSI